MPIPAWIVPEHAAGRQAGRPAFSTGSGDFAHDATWRRCRHRLRRAAALVTLIAWLAVPHIPAGAAMPQGVWLIDGKVAVQIFDCEGLLCGRILWLRKPRDPRGQFDVDRKNPDPALRRRRLCGLTILWGLRSLGPDRWRDGWFYNPDDGRTYSISAHLASPDVIMARIYVGLPLFGRTKTLLRVAHGTSAGWC